VGGWKRQYAAFEVVTGIASGAFALMWGHRESGLTLALRFAPKMPGKMTAPKPLGLSCGTAAGSGGHNPAGHFLLHG